MKIQISHTVVNISSHQLTDNETSLLSRGLNFCSVPGPINETKLSEELDNFARSLRINEHFGSKEVEGGDEVSSDSDSEDACDYRFVKKSEWVPKPSKNVTLESFIDNVKSDILRTAKVNTDTFDNLTPGERTLSCKYFVFWFQSTIRWVYIYGMCGKLMHWYTIYIK